MQRLLACAASLLIPVRAYLHKGEGLAVLIRINRKLMNHSLPLLEFPRRHFQLVGSEHKSEKCPL